MVLVYFSFFLRWYYFLLIPYLWNLHVCIFLLLFFFHKILFLIFFIKLNMFCVWVAFGGSLTFLIFDDFILTLCSFNIICDSSFVTFGSSLTFFLTFDCFILHYAVSTSHVTFLLSHSVIPFFFFFFSNLTVSSSHCVVPTSHVTVLLSYLMVPLFFSHIWQFYPCAVPTSLLRYTNFFLIFDCSIITLGNTNITYDCTFVTFNGSLFLLTFDNSIVTLSRTNITYGRCQPNPTPPNYLIINEYGYVWIHVLAPRLRLRLAYYWDPRFKTWKRELDLAKHNSCAKLETQIFLKQRTVSLIHQVLFMDSSCAK